jgi:hypothetical protein
MELKAGVIASGPMIWEWAPWAFKWRKLAFNDKIETRIPVSLRMRYGRKSASWQNTYTIVYSNDITVPPGRAFILPITDTIQNARTLEKNAFMVAAAERLKDAAGSTVLHAPEGAVGLLLHPEIDKKSKGGAEIIRERWSRMYAAFTDFNPREYCTEEDEQPLINQEGFVQLPWMPEMNDFDVLIVPLDKPDPRRILSPEEIAAAMKTGSNRTYFDKNVEIGIRTFQDDEIRRYLRR